MPSVFSVVLKIQTRMIRKSVVYLSELMWNSTGLSYCLPRRVLLATVLGGWLVFTLVAKKQAFYTLPVLPALAVLAATRPWMARLAVVGGLLAFLRLGVGVASAPATMPNSVTSIAVNAAGVITVTADATAGSYTSVLTPVIDNGVMRWTQSGTCLAAKYCQQ